VRNDETKDDRQLLCYQLEQTRVVLHDVTVGYPELMTPNTPHESV
jgi:hypothetical protein